MRFSHLLAACTMLVACGDGTGPGDEGRDESALAFARLESGAELETTDTTFWAVRGQARSLVIRYRDDDERSALEFHVGAQSLLTSPAGVQYQPGDSVQIRVRADADGRYVFDFQPSGLVFSPLEPAVLRIDYARSDPDYNEDGTINRTDAELFLNLRIWRQEAPGLLWLPLPSVRLETLQMIEADIRGFTGFAMAS